MNPNVFKSLINTNPARTSDFGVQLQAQQQAQLQQQIAATPTSTIQQLNIRDVSRQLGATQQTQLQQAQLQLTKQALQTQTEAAQQVSEAQRFSTEQYYKNATLLLKDKSAELANKLAKLDLKLKNELLDKVYEFEKDSAFRTVFKEKQLADYKLYTAKSEIELKKYEENVRQLSKRKTAILKAAHERVQREISNMSRRSLNQYEQNFLIQLEVAQKELAERLQKEANKKAARAAVISAVTTLVGAGIGAYVGDGAKGAEAGAKIGGAAGPAVAAAT